MGCLGITSEPVVLLYGIVFMINYTVLPQLLLQKICLRENNNNFTHCDGSNVSLSDQKSASIWWFYLLSSSLLPSTITVLIWGPLTDKIGRKKSIRFVALVDTLRSTANLVNALLPRAHPAFLLLGSFLPSLHGDVHGLIMVCYAYIADVTSEETDTRTIRMGLLEGSMVVSGVVAGLISGYTVETIGFVPLFLINVGIDVVMLVYTCYLPHVQYNRHFDTISINESECQLTDCTSEVDDPKSVKVPGNRTPLKQTQLRKSSSRFPLLEYITKSLDLVVNSDSSSSRVIVPMLCAFSVTIIALVGERVVQTLYLRNKPFFFTPKMIGYYTALQAAIRGIGTVLVTQFLHRIFKVNDYIMIIVGLLSQILVLVLTGLSTTVLSLYLACIAGMCVPVPMAAIRSVITKSVPENKYGRALASLSAADVFSSLITNTVSLWMYDLTMTMYSGTVYFGISIFSLISLTIVGTTYIKQLLEASRTGYEII